MNQLDEDTSECTEATTITLEWTVRDLRHLFETSKGDNKSKVVKSSLFGGGKWQCLFYPNSGTDGGAYVSLYLSCEPTVEEKENALGGKWSRDGLFKFSFELRDMTRNTTFNSRDASNHSFSYKTANWGWAQFARRDTVYYHALSVRNADAFKIVCSITSTPTVPTATCMVPTQTVPQDLLDTMGNLLDDPLYSDVEFVFPGKSSPSKKVKPRTISAARAVLKRADYFKNMFEAGFAETISSSETPFSSTNTSVSDFKTEMGSQSLSHNYEDSDEEDEANDEDETLDQDYEIQMHEDESLLHEDDKKSDEQANPFTDVKEKNIDIKSLDSKGKMQGPKKTRIVIKDFAYTTYRAVMYYLYTDSIVFAPVSSSFYTSSSQQSAVAASSFPSASSSQITLNLGSGEQSTGGLIKDQTDNKTTLEKKNDVPTGPASRKEWLKEWQNSKPNRVLPCSAKAAYRLADKLDLKDLKERAFQHIVKSLTVSNVAYEVFSSFSAMFEDVRKVQVDYFLSHWSDIRGSEAMCAIWQQIRLGRHPGFEEVWPTIALNLEYSPQSEEKKD